MYNSILFIVNVDIILNEKHYINTVEKLFFFTTLFYKRARKVYQVVKFMYRTEKNFRYSQQKFGENIEL